MAPETVAQQEMAAIAARMVGFRAPGTLMQDHVTALATELEGHVERLRVLRSCFGLTLPGSVVPTVRSRVRAMTADTRDCIEGEVACECDCGDEHYRTCSKCNGKGCKGIDSGLVSAVLDRIEGIAA